MSRHFFEDDYRSILAGSEVIEMHYPAIPYLSRNASQLPSLREKPSWKPEPRPIPADVTEGNFRQWMTIQLQTSDEDQQALGLDYLTEL